MNPQDYMMKVANLGFIIGNGEDNAFDKVFGQAERKGQVCKCCNGSAGSEGLCKGKCQDRRKP